MPHRVLLVINCAGDASYANRRVLDAIYQARFDRVLFAVSPTCPLDESYWNIIQSWSPPPDSPACICGDPTAGKHSALRHCLHPRLVEIARIEDDFEFVLFTEDDCLLSPALDAAAVRRRAADLDALTPPIFFCAREARDWTWAQHATGDPAYDAATRDWSRATLLRCWAAYGGQPLPDDHRLPMFFGFSDCLIFRFSFLRRLAADLARLLPVWHEAAIPSAVLYRAERLGKLQGLALWGSERERPLAELVALLGRDDYVHPIKLSRFAPDEFLAAYRALTGG